MADMTWTVEQKQVIDTRGRNLLVSAAAGSGKTAVLVERIIQMVTDPEHPVDIDRLLVMTFTNAAAAEMRERIGAALEKRLEDDPADRNLERQTTLIHHAKITTIDSFCLHLLREHFHELELDPGFRIGDEGELLLLQADVMKSLLEEYYAGENPNFLQFVDMYASGKADGGLEDYIMQVYRFSQSHPWPGEWLEHCRKELLSEDAKHPESFEETEWMQFLIQDVQRQAEEWTEQLAEAIELAEEEDGPQVYLPMLWEDKRMTEQLSEAANYQEIYQILSGPIFGRLAAVRSKQVDLEKKELAAAIRNRVKDAVKKLKELYVPGELDRLFSDMLACREPLLMLLELTEAFDVRYQAAKEEKNLLDFNDLEHFALRILTDGTPEHGASPAADELSRFYEEILVDEYQDSNEVQEALIQAISRERFGTPNVFMVGDVKQSIYKFRLAKPELFLEKYERYGKEEGAYQKIELHKNFRSRHEVLDSINGLFYQIMTKSLGNIRYTDDAALYAGADYPETIEEGNAKTELLLLDTSELSAIMDEERADYTAKEAEARLIAAKIRELTDPVTGMQIWNGKKGQYEPLKKKDIVILLRSLTGWAEEFVSVLNAEGIAAFAESRTGYFSAVEVETILNMLALIDNPMQDIPLVSVLKSPIGGFSDRELAILMAAYKKKADKGQDMGFYAVVRSYLNTMHLVSLDGSNTILPDDLGMMGDSENVFDQEEYDLKIYKKLSDFWKLLTSLRHEAGYLPVHRLIYRIFERTGYYDYVSVMPAGHIRQANLDMLVEKASLFEKTSYQSLFDFIRYIEKLKKYNTDFGEAAGTGEDEDTVRIMSIHKSKGLEFPVVFLAGAAKAFNRQDSRGKILIDESLGIAADYFDTELHVKAPTLKKHVLSRRMNLESMGEELRILYVAMTRAKEKLIVTAGDRHLEKRLEKWEHCSTGTALPFTYLSAAGSYLEWILMAMDSMAKRWTVREIPVRDLILAETKKQAEQAGLYLSLKMMREHAQPEEYVTSWLTFRYPYEADLALHAKMSVSELKQQGQFQDDAESAFLPTIPEFMMREASQEMPETEAVQEVEYRALQEETDQIESVGQSSKNNESETDTKKKSTPGGAIRGTAYHRFMELLDFKSIGSWAELMRQVDTVRKNGKMTPQALDMIWMGKIWKFCQSSIAERMKRADLSGTLHKESQFVMGIPARLMDEADSDEPILIQGIIDAWFEEDGEIVLVDYKTDWIEMGQEQVLLERYQLQMVYYAQALQQITGKKVKEAVIYSFAVQEEIKVEVLL